MPNWALNKLVVKGEPDALRSFLADNKTDEEFSFHALVPMPDVLDGTISPSRTSGQLLRMVQSQGLTALQMLNGEKGESTFPDMPATIDVSAAGVVQAKAIIEAYKAQGGTAHWILDYAQGIEGNWLAKEATGYSNWFDWACANWGTKWDCSRPDIFDSRIDEGELIIDFETTWCSPEQWFRTVVSRYPDLAFTLDTGEPDCDFHVTFDGLDGSVCLSQETDFRSMAKSFWEWELDEEAVEA